jgi:epidermal growth factor receptor substrate 15
MEEDEEEEIEAVGEDLDPINNQVCNQRVGERYDQSTKPVLRVKSSATKTSLPRGSGLLKSMLQTTTSQSQGSSQSSYQPRSTLQSASQPQGSSHKITQSQSSSGSRSQLQQLLENSSQLQSLLQSTSQSSSVLQVQTAATTSSLIGCTTVANSQSQLLLQSSIQSQPASQRNDDLQPSSSVTPATQQVVFTDSQGRTRSLYLPTDLLLRQEVVVIEEADGQQSILDLSSIMQNQKLDLDVENQQGDLDVENQQGDIDLTGQANDLDLDATSNAQSSGTPTIAVTTTPTTKSGAKSSLLSKFLQSDITSLSRLNSTVLAADAVSGSRSSGSDLRGSASSLFSRTDLLMGSGSKHNGQDGFSSEGSQGHMLGQGHTLDDGNIGQGSTQGQGHVLNYMCSVCNVSFGTMEEAQQHVLGEHASSVVTQEGMVDAEEEDDMELDVL